MKKTAQLNTKIRPRAVEAPAMATLETATPLAPAADTNVRSTDHSNKAAAINIKTDNGVDQTKRATINPVVRLMKMRAQRASVEMLLAAMNENYAVIKYGNEILVASIIGNEVACMTEQHFHKMFANLDVFNNRQKSMRNERANRPRRQ